VNSGKAQASACADKLRRLQANGTCCGAKISLAHLPEMKDSFSVRA
jgi:hypothetical protein